MKQRRYGSIKKRLFWGMMLFLLSSGVARLVLEDRMLTNDKTVSLMDLNLALLDSASSAITLALKTRLDELATLAEKLNGQAAAPPAATEVEAAFDGITEGLKGELLGVSYYQMADASSSPQLIRRIPNAKLLSALSLSSSYLDELDKVHPLPQEWGEEFKLVNRSMSGEENHSLLPIITFMVPVNYVDNSGKKAMVTFDLTQDFLIDALRRSRVAEMFLISSSGELISHENRAYTVEYSSHRFSHPILPYLKEANLAARLMQLKVNGKPYLCSLMDTGLSGLRIVSQIKKKVAFHSLDQLRENGVLLSAVLLYLGALASLLFARGLTRNIQSLKAAAETVGSGNLDLELNLKGNDEIKAVAESFQWMAVRLKDLMKESIQKTRMEEELKTARFVQSTLLSPPSLSDPRLDLSYYYRPATEIGGDFWDIHFTGNKVTVLIGDATGHGAAAAIVTAVAKSCFSTLTALYPTVLSPEKFMKAINYVLFKSCHGELLMTMVMIQLDLETGEVKLCNAGHELPLCLRFNGGVDGGGAGGKAEPLFARGERLGFDLKTQFESVTLSLGVGDTLLLYTDGVFEAKNKDGKMWGERTLRKLFSREGMQDVPRVKEAIQQRLDEFTDGTPLSDDITYVVLRWRQTLRKAA